MKPGNLDGGNLEEIYIYIYNIIYWGEAPNIPLYLPQNPPQDSQVSLSTSGLFHTLEFYTVPCVRWRILAGIMETCINQSINQINKIKGLSG